MSGLKQELGLGQGVGLLSTSLLGTGVFAVPALAALVAGDNSLWAWPLLILLVFPIAIVFALLGRHFPSAGGVAHFVDMAFGPRLASVTGWLFLSVIPVGLPAALHIATGFGQALFGWHDAQLLLAELGTLAGVEDDVKVSAEDSSYTHPEEVEEFVSKTGCDSLAIAIGTSHGAYKFKPGTKPQLRFDVLDEVVKRLPGFPIVLHGSSSVPQEFVEKINKFGGNMPGAIGVPEDQLRQAARSAVCKINIDSDLRLAMTATIREYFAEHPGDFDPRQYLKPARQAIKEMVAHKIVDVLGCDHKAF